jgi:hypothetical protein
LIWQQWVRGGGVFSPELDFFIWLHLIEAWFIEADGANIIQEASDRGYPAITTLEKMPLRPSS